MQQLVAIARALSVDAKVLILDEPTSSLDDSEVESLFAVLRGLRESGLAILFVTHFLDQVYAISDRITVLRNGRFVGEWTPAQLPAPALVSAMVGRDVALASAESVDAEAPAKPRPARGRRAAHVAARPRRATPPASAEPRPARRRGGRRGRPARLGPHRAGAPDVRAGRRRLRHAAGARARRCASRIRRRPSSWGWRSAPRNARPTASSAS